MSESFLVVPAEVLQLSLIGSASGHMPTPEPIVVVEEGLLGWIGQAWSMSPTSRSGLQAPDGGAGEGQHQITMEASGGGMEAGRESGFYSPLPPWGSVPH